MNSRALTIIICIFGLILFAGQPSVVNADENTTERAGDIMQILIPATAFASTLVLHDKEGMLQFAKSFIVNQVVTQGLKYTINKQRPEDGNNDSFPSGHTSAAFQGATFIHKRYGVKYGIPAYIGASFVGWSRVDAKKHYTVDVLAGAAIGILSSCYFTTPYKDISVTPVADNGFYGLHLSKKW